MGKVGPGIFWEFCKLNLAMEGIAWRTLLMIFMDQMPNLYLLLKLMMNIYLVDVVLNTKTEGTDVSVFKTAFWAFGVCVFGVWRGKI